MKKRKILLFTMLVSLVGVILTYPPQWYPNELRLLLSDWFGATAYRDLPDSKAPDQSEPETYCPEDFAGWRQEQEIEGVSISASLTCESDNPFAIAAFVRGTNNVSQSVLMKSGLTPDTVVKGMGGALGFIATIIGLGAIFGQILENSGGAKTLANSLVNLFGQKRASWAMLLTGFMISIPVFLDVGRDAMEAGRSWKESVREALAMSDTLLLVFDPGMAARLAEPENAVLLEIETAHAGVHVALQEGAALVERTTVAAAIARGAAGDQDRQANAGQHLRRIQSHRQLIEAQFDPVGTRHGRATSVTV